MSASEEKEQNKAPQVPQVYAARTDVGCVREHNEDSFIAATPLFVVADGMGGHEAGEVASEIAIKTMLENAPATPNGDALVSAVKAANYAIIAGANEGIGRPGMGTTMTAAQIFDDQLFIVQVGDSRAYLLHEGTLQQVTRDHSLMADLIEQGRITEEEARYHPQRSVITRALGSDITVEPDLYVLRVTPGDRLLLCSDGLSGMVENATIAAILRENEDPQNCCDALIHEALAAGGMDNVTCVVVDPLKEPPRQKKKQGSWLKRHMAPIIFALAFVLIIAAAAGGFYAYAQSSYFVAEEDGYVCIYRGLPGDFAGIKVNWLEQQTDIPTNKLVASVASRLEKGVGVSSLQEAQSLIADYRSQISGGALEDDATGTDDASGSSAADSADSSASNAKSGN